jgi:hypothetical protein
MADDIRLRALVELSEYPRGSSGSSQNLFRMALFDGLLNFYGSRPDPAFTSRDDVLAFATRIVREHDPTFEPLKQASAVIGIPIETLALVETEVELPVDAEAIAGRLSDASFTLQWLRLSAEGAWLLSVFDESGTCIDRAPADDPQDALLAVADRLLPPTS